MLRNFAGLLALGLAVAGCNPADSIDNAAANGTRETTSAVTTTDDVAVRSSDTNSAVAVSSATLSGFVGKHPRDAEGGTSFLDQPLVRDAVARTVTDAKIRDFIFGYNGPDTPIALKNGRLIAWGCERHNCGFHNWAITIAPDGSAPEICFYQNESDSEGRASWFVPGQKPETRAGNCPSE